MMDLDMFYRFVAIFRGQGYSEPKAYREAEAKMEDAMKLNDKNIVIKPQGEGL